MSYPARTPSEQDTEFNGSLTGRPLWVRLLYALGAGVMGYLTFGGLLLLGVVQFIYIAVTKSKNQEMVDFSMDLLRYLGEVLAFIGFQTDKPPFPFAPFPSSAHKDSRE